MSASGQGEPTWLRRKFIIFVRTCHARVASQLFPSRKFIHSSHPWEKKIITLRSNSEKSSFSSSSDEKKKMIFCLICALSFHTQCGGCFNDSNAARGAEHTADLWWWWTYTTFVGKLSTDTSPPPVLVVFWSRSFRIYARSSLKSWIFFYGNGKTMKKIISTIVFKNLTRSQVDTLCSGGSVRARMEKAKLRNRLFAHRGPKKRAARWEREEIMKTANGGEERENANHVNFSSFCSMVRSSFNKQFFVLCCCVVKPALLHDNESSSSSSSRPVALLHLYTLFIPLLLLHQIWGGRCRWGQDVSLREWKKRIREFLVLISFHSSAWKCTYKTHSVDLIVDSYATSSWEPEIVLHERHDDITKHFAADTFEEKCGVSRPTRREAETVKKWKVKWE